MAVITVRDRQIDVDIRSELEQHEWTNATWTDEKLIASSPFRSDDRSPSFYIDFVGEYAGVWGDSGAEDDYYKSGRFPKLLAYLWRISEEEAEDYLLEQYDIDYSTDDFKLVTTSIDLDERVDRTPLSGLDEIVLDTDYLPSRGIHPKVIEMMNVFDNGNSIGIPWCRPDGQVASVKYRHKEEKTFWYAADSVPIGDLVYGLDIVIERGITRAVLCEAEVDAMTWMSAGIFAIAIGGARLNDKQADMILSSGLTEILLGGDNDVAGRRFNEIVADKLRNKVELYDINYGMYSQYKDANDIGVEGLRNITITNRRAVPMIAN